jgi:hypothetical protein
MAESQVPTSTDSFTHKVTSPAWKTKPAWYMVATADKRDTERACHKAEKGCLIHCFLDNTSSKKWRKSASENASD